MTVQAIEVAATGSPLAVLRMQRSGLPAAEARVADAILDSPQLVTSESIGDLAARAGSATATVIRMCRRVGFDGFYRLKISLAQELGAVRQFGHPVILGGDAPSVLQTAMLADAEEIANAVGLIDPDAFATAVDRLVSAREVLFAGVGTSAPVAQLGALRFLVLGLRATVLVDVQAQDLAARLLPPGSCCVLVS
ncbi:MAG: MurR/RpiR family transcriptional regulator, partial [Acidimicrobiales bacterium]